MAEAPSNTHNTRSLIRTSHVCHGRRAAELLTYVTYVTKVFNCLDIKRLIVPNLKTGRLKTVVPKMQLLVVLLITPVFLYSCLKRRKQGVKVNDTESFLYILLSDVSQGSILGPFLFNVILDDFFFYF